MTYLVRQKGFSVAEVFIIVMVVALLCLGGWYVFSKMDDKKENNKPETNSQTSEPAKDAKTTITSAEWLEQDDSKYKVKIPDGWKLTYNTESGSMIEACGTCLTYVAGKKAAVESSSAGRGGPFRFFLKPQAQGETEALFFGDYEKTGAFTAQNVTGTTYYKVAEGGEMESPSGSRVYGYAFTKGSNVVFVTYTVQPNDQDELEVVEEMLATLEIK